VPELFIAPKKYIQHDLAVADGLESFGALLKQLPPNSAKVSRGRRFAWWPRSRSTRWLASIG
jgi:hypothetical protein